MTPPDPAVRVHPLTQEERDAREIRELKAELQRLAQTCAQLQEAKQRLDQWRVWAQFVYLGGGFATSTETDHAMQASVCAAHDKDMEELKTERDALRTALETLLAFDVIQFANDHGPYGEGWQSVELSSAIASALALLASARPPETGATR